MLNTFLTIVFVLISILMICIVLLQRGRGGGLVGAFGAGGGQSAFGTKTGDVFTTATVIIFVVFLLLAFILNWRVGASPTAVSKPVSPQSLPVSSGKSTTPSKSSTVPSAGLPSGKASSGIPAKSAVQTPATTKP